MKFQLLGVVAVFWLAAAAARGEALDYQITLPSDVEPTTRVISNGQQPFPNEVVPNPTPSQGDTNQLNQLFQFETTPDKCAAGEWYATGNFDYLKFPGSVKSYRYQVQGQYGITDQIAVGGFVPLLSTKVNGTHFGVGDIGIYGQYKFDKFINPEVVDVTGQVDVIFPTGNRSVLRDTGKLGVRPLALAYKDFGMQGPGDLGVYGVIGFTATTNSDFRVGLAATYEYRGVVGVVEFFDQAGRGRPLVQMTPGLIYRGTGPWEVGVGVPLGIARGTPDWGIIFKLTYAFRR